LIFNNMGRLLLLKQITPMPSNSYDLDTVLRRRSAPGIGAFGPR
jgi:hypothetical protein